ncbi:MAG: hypothetical protein ACNA7K_06080 [Acholeplasmataceae bacterium]|jgi:hypothetical protein
MLKDSKLIKFIKVVSNGRESLSLTYSDFLPLESIIDYRTIIIDDKLTTFDFSDYCRESTKRIIVNINTNRNSTFEQTKKILELLRLQFNKQDIEIEFGSKTNLNENETTVDIVLYKD